MPRAVLTISSRNYSSWSLRGWLMCRLAGLDFEEEVMPSTDPTARAELLLRSPTIRIPCLRDGEVTVWDTLAIGEYLNERFPQAHLLPKSVAARAHCRAISGEMHSGFAALRAGLPMNLKAHYPRFKVWAGAQADIDHVQAIWRTCLETYEGPFLFGKTPTVADAMYAPVCTRFATYDVALDRPSKTYCDGILALPAMVAWKEAALAEPEAVEELEAEF